VTFHIGREAPPKGDDGPGGGDPGGGDPGGGGNKPPGGGGVKPPATDTPARFTLSKPGKTTLASFVKRGATVKVQCNQPMSGTAKLTVTAKVARKLGLGKRTTLATAKVKCTDGRATTVKLRPANKAVKRALTKARAAVSAKITVKLKPRKGAAKTHQRALVLRLR
jgi:hypothetical protein